MDKVSNSPNHNNIINFEIDPDGPNPHDRQNSPPHPRSPLNNQQNRHQPSNVSPSVNPDNNRNPEDIDDKTFFQKIRGSLMIVAILAAGSTYQAGMNPPGSVWQDADGHKAGTPILHDTFFDRYQVFFYCNAVSFLSSLVIIIFLLNRKFYSKPRNIKVLEITMLLDLLTFTAAYSVGSCRRFTTSVYVFLIMGAVFLFVFFIFLANHFTEGRTRSRDVGQTGSTEMATLQGDDNV